MHESESEVAQSCLTIELYEKEMPADFPGGPVAKTELPMQGPRFDPWTGN